MSADRTQIVSSLNDIHRSDAYPLDVIAVGLGAVMLLVSAFIYPTYMHHMGVQWIETTRLIELPFVVFEIMVVLWALKNGFSALEFVQGQSKQARLALIIFLISMFISSSVISQRPAISMLWSLITIVHLLFAGALLFLLRQTNLTKWRNFMNWHAIGLLLLACYTAWWFLTPPPESEVPGGLIEWDSALPGFIHLRHFGSWTGAVAAGFALKILYDNSDKIGWAHWAYFLSAGMTVWSGTRAAILAMIIVLLAVISLRRQWPSFRAIGWACIFTGAAMTVAWLLLPPMDWHKAGMFRLYVEGDAESVRSVTSGRVDIWRRTFQEWLTSPFIGLGTGSTLWELEMNWPHTQPHNSILQFLISWGITGTIPALYLLFRALRRVSPFGLSSPDRLALLAMLYCLLVQSLFEGMLHYPRFIIAIVAIFALLTALSERENQCECVA